MKLLVISLGALLVAGLAFLVAPDPTIQPAKTIPIMEIPREGPRFTVPRQLWPEPKIELAPPFDCNVGDFLQDKKTDSDWSHCPMAI